MPPSVVITPSDTIDVDLQRRVFEERVGAEVIVPETKNRNEIVATARDANALVVGDADVVVDQSMITELPSLEVIGKCGIGVDNIDITAADDHGIVVLNSPTYATEEVSTHALTLVLSTVRKVPIYDRAVRRGEWDWQTGRPLHRLAGMTLGFSSFGKIARRVAEKARSLNVKMLAADPYVDDEVIMEHGVEPVDFEQLLVRSDAVSVHTPYTPETDCLFDAAAFKAMQDDAYLVNTGRGCVVDEGDLYDALTANELAGAALDVMAEEPPDDSPLFDLDEVTVTPHVAWYSESSRRELSETVARDTARVLSGECPDSAVDPEMDWL